MNSLAGIALESYIWIAIVALSIATLFSSLASGRWLKSYRTLVGLLIAALIVDGIILATWSWNLGGWWDSYSSNPFVRAGVLAVLSSAVIVYFKNYKKIKKR